MKKILLLLALALVPLEIICFLFLKFYFYPQHNQFFQFDYEKEFSEITPEYISQFSGKDSPLHADVLFDPVLGWDNKPNFSGINKIGCHGKNWEFSFDEMGSRNTPSDLPLRDPVIALYGGSYTMGAEVEDDQTWQYVLEQLSGVKILNFGVGGYGTDQALFKLEDNLQRGVTTPVVVLGVYSGAIQRLVTTYRPFFVRNAGLKLGFKPTLLEVDGGYERLPGALKDLDSESLNRAFNTAAEHDYFYSINKLKPRMRFPYSLTTLKVVKYILFDFESNRKLWQPEHLAAGRMDEIVSRFVKLSRSEEFLPVLVFMPQEGELAGYDNNEPAQYAEYFENLRKQYTEDELVMIDVLAEEINSKEFSLPGCHPSEYGNKKIAASIYSRLENRLMELSEE